jgi:hypothetical protein
MKKITSLFTLIYLLLSCSIIAQVAGDVDTKIQAINFNQQLSNVSLDPAPKIGLDTRQTIKEKFGDLSAPKNLGGKIAWGVVSDLMAYAGFQLPGFVNTIIETGLDVGISPVTPTLNCGVTLDYGGYIELNRVGNANLKVDYPVEITISYPQTNTFGCGDAITIQTSYVVKENENMLAVTPPFYETEIGPILENLKFEIGASLSVYNPFGANWNSPAISILSKRIPLPSFLDPLPPLVNACETAFGANKNESDLIACTTGPSSILELAQTVLDGYGKSQSPPRDYGFATLTANEILIETPSLPTGTSPSIPEVNGSFKKVTYSDLSFSSLNNGKKLKVTGNKTELSKIDFDLISLLDLAFGKTTSLDVGGGIGSLDFGDISPTFSIDQNMNFEFNPIVHLTIDLGKAMAYEVHDDVLGMVSSGFGISVNLIAGQKIVAIYPPALSEPTLVKSSSGLDGDFTTLTTQEYFNSTKINLMQLKIGSSFNESVFNLDINRKSTGAPIKIQDHSFNLTGFNSINLSDILLDPENPIINIENLTVEDIVNIGGGEREVVYKVVVNNGGDVELRNSNIKFDLSQAFANASNLEVRCIYSEDLEINSEFDGINDKRLLGVGNTLAVGQTSMVEILVRVKPEIAKIASNGCFEPVEYNMSAFANGTSPIGTEVINNFYHCTGERTGEDIVAIVDLGASIIESINDFAIYGWKAVVLDKELGQSWGNVGSSESIRFENSSQKGGDDITIVGDLQAGNEVFVQGESRVVADYIQVANDVKIPNKKSYVNETGATSSFSGCVAVTDKVELNFPNQFGSKKIEVKENATLELVPGNYKEVKLQSNSTLKMRTGTYNIGKWVFMGDNSQVLYNTSQGAINLNLDAWQALGRENLELKVENNGSPSDVHYNYKGNQLCKFNNSFVQGQINAPNAEIEFALGSIFEGSCYADKVNFKTGASFKGNTYLDEINLNPMCLEATTNRQKIAKLSETLGQKANISNAKIIAYPNPVKSNLKIVANNEMKTITIHSILGKQIFSIALNDKEKIINFDTFSKGIYFITVQFENEKQTLKIIKK